MYVPARNKAVPREGARHRKSTDSSGSLPQRRMAVQQHIKNVVLVHGAFADGSGWEAVANILANDGYKVSVAQPPETSYADDRKYTKAAIEAMGGPVVLVGHSYGGARLTPRPNNPNQRGRVFFFLFLSMNCRTVCSSHKRRTKHPTRGN